MATVISPAENESFTMYNIPWASYTHLADEIENNNVRVTYDNGCLEIMTLSYEHEGVKTIASRLLETWAYEKNWPVTGCGQMTLRRQDMLIGLEPDECYYVRPDPPPMMPGLFDLHTYPPPDLAIEVEVSRAAVDKVSIYARLGVPEVWRWTGERFVVLQRGTGGQYAERSASALLAELPMDVLAELVRFAIEHGQPAAVRRLRDRLRPA